MSKKAEIQFYLVFVLIAGAIILAFLVSFGLKFKEVQEEKTTIRVLNNLESSFSELQGSQFQTSTSFRLPVDMRVVCTPTEEVLLINGRSLKSDNLIFSLGNLNEEVLIGFSPDKLPFKITNFFYIIKKTDTYSLVYDNSNEEVVREIGKDFKSYFPDNVEITNDPKNQIKVYFERNDNADLYVIPETEESGKIYFNGGNSLDYYNKAMLYGAIISRENSACLFEKADNIKLEVIISYRNKISHLPANCNYNNLLLNFQKMENLNGKELVDAAKALEKQNEALLNENCPLVF